MIFSPRKASSQGADAGVELPVTLSAMVTWRPGMPRHLKVLQGRCSSRSLSEGPDCRSLRPNACQVVSAFPLHVFRVFVLLQLIISPFPLLPDVSCLAYSLLLALPFVSGLSPGSGQCQTSASALPTTMATRSPEHHALCPFTARCPRRHLRCQLHLAV